MGFGWSMDGNLWLEELSGENRKKHQSPGSKKDSEMEQMED